MAKEFEEKSKKAAKENATEEEIQSELKLN